MSPLNTLKSYSTDSDTHTSTQHSLNIWKFFSHKQYMYSTKKQKLNKYRDTEDTNT